MILGYNAFFGDNIEYWVKHHRPNFEGKLADGVLVYLNANPDLSTVLEKVPPAGGEILIEKR